MSESSPGIAVIMRSHNDIDVIRDTLKMLSRQSLQNFELWNFALRSTDGTLEVIQQYNHADRIIHSDPAGHNPGRVLNDVVAKVKAEILVFLDPDATPADEYWLENLIEPLKDPNVGAVFGRQVSRPDCRSLFVKDKERAFGDGTESASWLHFFSMANSAARTRVLKHFPFETALPYGQDMEWSYRLRRGGHHVRYVADAIVFHSHNYSLKQIYKRYFGEGIAYAFIFSEGELSASWSRNFLTPFGMEIFRDLRWALNRCSADALLHSIPLRFVQKWARWRGIRKGRQDEASSCLSTRVGEESFTFDGNRQAETRVARDQAIIGAHVRRVVARENFAALVLMGGYGRGEGGYRYQDGRPSPYNDYDYVVMVKGMNRRRAGVLQQQLKHVALQLQERVGVEVNLAVMPTETLVSAPFTLMNAEMKWGHRIVTGDHRVLKHMPGMPFDKLPMGEFTRLMNNRGALLLMNTRMLSENVELSHRQRETFFKHLFKTVLACGDAYLAVEGAYHPSYVEKKKRITRLRQSPGPNFIKLYRLAVEQKFYPDPDRFGDVNLPAWQRRITDCWLAAFSRLEMCRTDQRISNWREYASPNLPKGQLETSRLFRNFVISLRDFGTSHTMRHLHWALRYPRERLISVLPLLLNSSAVHTPVNVAVTLAVSPDSDRRQLVDCYLETWQRYS